MSQVKPFRFGVQSRSIGPTRDSWIETVRRVETLGYDTLMWPDHFVRGFEPIAAMAAAAMVTDRLKVCGFVFDNDFRHPVVLAMSIGSIDILSAGRVELGIGAGWLKDEYDMSGIPFDPVGKRIDRLEEAIPILKSLLAGEKTSFQGEFYQLAQMQIPPAPVQKPYPPLIIGGGSPRVLRLAAREADIVSVTTRALPDGSKDHADGTAAATARKIEWIREAAGDRFGRIELNTIIPTVEITDDRHIAAERLAADLPITAAEVLDSPATLLGTVDDIVETLLERRQRYGFSYVVVLEPVMEAFAPVVAQLAGR